MFDKTFFHFFFAFVVIIAIAFGVLIVAGSHITPEAVDNVALPQ